MSFPSRVKLVEVGPRDGLQNEHAIVPTQIKIEFINRLSQTGLSVIEATSFVSPKWIPQLADHKEVYLGIEKKEHVSYPVLVPNIEGFNRAHAAGVKEMAVFTTPSEQFSQYNTSMSVAESLNQIKMILDAAKSHKIKVRGYISCVLGCPYEGKMDPEVVADIAKQLIELGCYEISLGDTIGIGTPLKTKQLLSCVSDVIPIDNIAVHFHDTYGQSLTNIYVALEQGIHIIDCSVIGLGGCPYAKGASGNVASEDVLYLLNEMGIHTGVDLDKLIAVGRYIAEHLGCDIKSKVNVARAM